MLLPRFIECINLLKRFERMEIEEMERDFQEQIDSLEREKKVVSEELRRTKQNGFLSNKQLADRISEIESGDLLELRSVLKSQQQNQVSSKAKMVTIGRIARYREEIERIQKSMNENDLKVLRKAKLLRAIMKEIEKINNEHTKVTDALDALQFIEDENILIHEIADYEIERLFQQFEKR